MPPNDGGPAFSGVKVLVSRAALDEHGNPTLEHELIPAAGMSLRDYFAASALQGILGCEQCHPKTTQSSDEELASCAYEIADAMLAERAIYREPHAVKDAKSA